MINEENVLNYPNGIETRVALLEMSIVNINQTLIRLEAKMDKQLDEIKDEIKDVRNDMKDIRRDMKTDFRWIMTIFGAAIIGLAGIMAHGFHWF